jgi:hypothetical protein
VRRRRCHIAVPVIAGQLAFVYKREKVESALQNFFRESTLVTLREMALHQAAHEVKHRIGQDEAGQAVQRDTLPHRSHRILVLVTEDSRTAMLIRRARRVSDFLEAECFAGCGRADRRFERLWTVRRRQVLNLYRGTSNSPTLEPDEGPLSFSLSTGVPSLCQTSPLP